MGTYRAPQQLVDTSYQEANKQIAFNINKYDQLYAQRKEEQKIRMEKNAELQEKAELAKVQGFDKWNKELSQQRPEYGYGSANNKKIEEWGDEYYELSGKTDKESLKRMAELRGYPKLMAEWYGAARANDEAYTKGLEYGKDEAYGIDYTNSNHDNLLYSAAFHNQTGELTVDEAENGELMIRLGDLTQNAQTFVDGSMKGNSYLRYNGDVMSTLGGTIEGIQKEIKYLEKGTILEDKRGSTQTTDVDWTAANNEYKESLRNFNYDKTLGNQKYMSSIFPQLINKVQTAADADPKSQAAQLLYGKDGVPGGEGVNADANMEVGPWVGSDVEQFGKNAEFQRALATEGFYEIGTSDQYMKPDKPIRTKTTLVNMKPGGNNSNRNGGSYTKGELRNINDKGNQKLYNDNLKFSQGLVKLVNKTVTNKGGVGTTVQEMPVEKAAAITKLANKINKINATRVDTQNPVPKGTYKLNEEKNQLYFYPTAADADPYQVDVNWQDPASINRFISVQSKAMDDYVYDYYSDQGGGASQFND